jgi:Holliday junction resolvase RusA-like endonuclease
MTPVVSFTVPGDPVTWKRAKRGQGRSYTDPKDAAHREKIRAFARQAGIRQPLRGAVRLDVYVFTRFDPLDRRSGDRDNHEKAIKDALTGIAFVDDIQVVDGRTRKARDEGDPRTEIEIAEIADPFEQAVGGGSWQAVEDADLYARERVRRVKGDEPA